MQGPVARPLPLESELMPDGRSACAKGGSETVPPREPLRDQLPALWRPDPGSARSADAQRRSAASRTRRSQWFSIPAGRRPAGSGVLKSRWRPGDATKAAFIATNDTINTRVGFIKWAKPAALFGIRYISESKT